MIQLMTLPPPLVIVPDNLAEAQTSQDYFISVTAKDNKDIQDVTITYTIANKTVSDQQMTQNTYNGNYDYRIPQDHLLATVPNFTFTVTATDVSGLKTITKISTITINDNLKITTISPSPDTSTDCKTLPIGVTFINGGASPKITYTLKNNGEEIITDKEIPVRSAGIALDELGPLPVGNYTATVKIVRSEDGTTMSREWHFTVTE
ncbi:5'-nucleotidase [Fusibacter sp. 3D3]|nr:5'-nucleotidase [Fusibacter sp. 3D3]